MSNVPTLQTAADLTASQIAGAASALLPSGVVLPYAGAAAPTGWLLCNGQLLTRTTYPDLFAAISTAHGTTITSGPTSNFALPDYRGRFLRGVDTMGTAAGRDPDKAGRTAASTGGATGDNVGSVQAEDFKSHVHGGINSTSSNSGGVNGVVNRDLGFTSNIISASTGGNETRPLNAYVNYIIKT